MTQRFVTTATGKRLIGKAIASSDDVQAAAQSGTVVVIAGTTNGYVAEELLTALSQAEGFSRTRFFRGITKPPMSNNAPSEKEEFPGDVVVTNGIWQKGTTIFDVVDDLKEGDIVIKGANALDPVRRRAAVLIGHPQGGTILASLTAVVGRRVRLILPVGLEKRVAADLDDIADQLNQPGAKGPRMMPLPGEVVTELEAISFLSGVTATLVAAGGVCGAEGGAWLALEGNPEQEDAAATILSDAAKQCATSDLPF